ncbi:PEGA domain-containing protein [Desulfatiglans anilini]|uniref:PEGA domain-containing protein n=1 Tax=Desulfatiglans anilini TaxID=90728 RepID=UPI0004201A1B|nr:PEGA domain-containing protein [Desulfatiglans anilini]
MKICKRLCIIIGLITLFAGGCSTPVLKQDIPVSTNPMGAKMYADGQYVGTTPGTVSLERTRSHILTLQKENYHQEDVVIQRLYQKDRAYLKAIQSGVHSGLFFKDPAMGVGSSMSSLDAQEKTGEAYVLTPSAVKVTLTPLGSAGGAAPLEQAVDSPANGVPAEQAASTGEAAQMSHNEMVREVVKIGADAALSQANPLEKKVKTSSSSKEYVTADGTRVKKESSTSVGVGVNPAGLVNAIDALFK